MLISTRKKEPNMTVIIPYSFVGAGVPFVDSYTAGTFGDLPAGTTTLDWTASWATTIGTLAPLYPAISAQVVAGNAKWSNICDVLFVNVPDSGAPIAVTGPVARHFVVLGNAALDLAASTWPGLGANQAFGFYSPANPSPPLPPNVFGSTAWDASPGVAFASGGLFELLGEPNTGSLAWGMAHELGHSVFNFPDNGGTSTWPSDPSSIMYPSITGPLAGPNATDIAFAQQIYGAPTTNAQKVGVNGLIGQIYSCYMGARRSPPDVLGLAFWNNLGASGILPGLCLNLMSANGIFNNSPATPEFVTMCYEGILGRAPEPAGLAFWTGPGTTNAGALQGIATSVEAANGSATYGTTGRVGKFPNGTPLWFE